MVFLKSSHARALENGLALMLPMGWNRRSKLGVIQRKYNKIAKNGSSHRHQQSSCR